MSPLYLPNLLPTRLPTYLPVHPPTYLLSNHVIISLVFLYYSFTHSPCLLTLIITCEMLGFVQ